MIGQLYIPVLCLHFSEWPISIHNWVYIFHSVLSDPDIDILCSEECQMKKLLVCFSCFFQSHLQVLYRKNSSFFLDLLNFGVCSTPFLFKTKIDKLDLSSLSS